MSDSNIGARKDRNIRNHLFIVNGVINHVIKDNQEPVDLEIYDIKQCFDKLGLKETLNDAWDTGLRNDKFVLLYELNKKSQVSISTPVGMTERKEVKGILQQGGVWAGLLCSNELDTVGKEELNSGENLYIYKNCVPIPSLALVDDLFKISKCGSESVKSNAAINAKVEMKNLRFAIDRVKNEAPKCHHMNLASRARARERKHRHER